MASGRHTGREARVSYHEKSDPVVDLPDLRRQVRWCRHAVERLAVLHGVTSGVVIVYVLARLAGLAL